MILLYQPMQLTKCCSKFSTKNKKFKVIYKEAEDMLFRLMEQIAELEGVTEQLKADNQMEWVSRMNNIHNRATEIVNHDLIYN